MDIVPETVTFSGLTDLASLRVGGRVILASDEFFAPKENLVKPGRGTILPDKYTARGKWMDGWESRRKRTPGYDWCIIKLGFPGSVSGIDIDTNHFLGNHPAYASVDACDEPASTRVLAGNAHWVELLTRSPLKPGSQNLFAVAGIRRWTHLRLNIVPDGGVARFRAYGQVLPDWPSAKNVRIDLAALGWGGSVVAASDMFFGSKENLIMPGRAATMGEGWETKRRRGPGHDWAVIQLGRPGRIAKIEVDTNHFKGNYPDSCSLDVCHEPTRIVDALTCHDLRWKEVLPKTKLRGDARHVFTRELRSASVVTHVRLNIYPDGGVSRVRVFGTIA
jgi:allantoicase